MTAEQIQTLRALHAWLQLETGSDESMRALDAAIALAEQTCETCAQQTDRHPDLPIDNPSCLALGWPCALMGGRCGAWTAKEER